MTPRQRIGVIQRWISGYARRNRIQTLVVGISGGIDSAVVSTLCARTGLTTKVITMPIRQSRSTHTLSLAHGHWLTQQFSNVEHIRHDLTPMFRHWERMFPEGSDLSLANTRARLRMTCLYQIAQDSGGIVVGTGNRVEDFGVGFFTKYGDGGVDISPIGDCFKTQVWDMGRELGILDDIINAAPTDGLWADGRTDEDQLGMTYAELEHMMWLDQQGIKPASGDRARLKRYRDIRRRNLHKMLPIPVCEFPQE